MSPSQTPDEPKPGFGPVRHWVKRGIGSNQLTDKFGQPTVRLVTTLSKPTWFGQNNDMKPVRTPKPSPANARVNCSVCGNRFYFDETDAPPFCSLRCKAIDLNRWLGEEVRLPHEGGPEMGESVELDEDDA